VVKVKDTCYSSTLPYTFTVCKPFAGQDDEVISNKPPTAEAETQSQAGPSIFGRQAGPPL